MIRAVIFDMDGLMFETERVAFQMLQTACAKRGLQFTVDMKRPARDAGGNCTHTAAARTVRR